ncbi:MAG: NUDIX domain-containing protein [Candidatus Micrarchaeaceae archaeon]
MKRCIVAGAAVFNKRGELLLIKHRKLGIWVYPGGHLEDGENPMECAKREVKEETGIDIRIVDPVRRQRIKFDGAVVVENPIVVVIEDVPYKTGHHEHFDIVYLALSKGSWKNAKNSEGNKTRWLGKDEITKLETFENVKFVIKEAFSSYERFMHSRLG